jgi:hypothetical membrane protein
MTEKQGRDNRNKKNKLQYNYSLYSGVLFFILATQFITVMMLAAAIAPSYNFHNSAISDLGVISSTALLFNISLIIVGVLNIAGGYLYYQSHKRINLLILFTIAGIGALGTGIFPLNTSDLHTIFALIAFIFFNLQVLFCSNRVSGPMKYITLFLGILGLIFVVIMAIGDLGFPAIFGPIGHGGSERMIVYPPILWLILFGGYLMGKKTPD